MSSEAGASPAELVRTHVDGVHVLASLSPSRASDYLTCPLRYRLRTIDRLAEPPSPAAVRGTVVHQVLEALFDLPASERTPAAANVLLGRAWEAVSAAEPALGQMFAPRDPQGPDRAAWLDSCRRAVEIYFSLEDPRRLEPAEREFYVEALLGSRLLLRGFIDRLDIAPNGAVRIVDYKTGRSPGEGYEARALFQLKFYALVLWRTRGVVPTVLQLVYLGNAEVLRYRPDEQDLVATERKIEAVWHAIEEARSSGEWQPQPGPLCAWCSFRALCPAFGGTPPPLPQSSQDAVVTDPAVLPTGQPAFGR